MAASVAPLAPAWPHCFDDGPLSDPFCDEPLPDHASFELGSADFCHLLPKHAEDSNALRSAPPLSSGDAPDAPVTPSKHRSSLSGGSGTDNRSEASSDASDWCLASFDVDAGVAPAKPAGPPASLQLENRTAPAEQPAGSVLADEPPEIDAAAATQAEKPYVLVRLDARGRVVRKATQADLDLLTMLLQKQPAVGVGAKGRNMRRAASSAAGLRKPGGPCCHCYTTESPQWRRGPATKPTLCNACGTRFRRTNQLGPAMPAHLKERGKQTTSQRRRALDEKRGISSPRQ